MAWKEQQTTKHSVQFFASVDKLPPKTTATNLRLTLLCARTSDNPKLFAQCVSASDIIFLEKPGAPSVAQLETMQELAQQHGTTVYMGFNKNVSSYVKKSLTTLKNGGNLNVTFLHNNNYKPSELPECFERNAEGMLKNMAIHELAILVTYYGVTVDTIATVEADKDFSSCQTLQGPSSGAEFTDFDKLKFKITTKDGAQVHVAADRCGGDDSVGIVTDARSGEELARFSMPDDETVANAPALQQQYGDAMPYFFAQDPDYLKLKQLVVQNCLDGTPAHGVATIDTAIETLKVAEYLTPLLQEQLK